jgi:hypothetical protein
MSFDPDDIIGVLGSTATGAASGTTFGPVGAAIGGAAGLGVGLAGAISQNRLQREAEEEQADLERKLANADQYAFDMMRDVGAANANQRRNLLAESEATANRVGLVGGAASQYSRDVTREVSEAQGAQMPSIASGVAQAIPLRREQIADEALQKQELMNMQTATDYLSGAANLVGQGAKLAGGLKDYADRQANDWTKREPTDEQLLEAASRPDYQTLMDPAAQARREQQQYVDYILQQQMAKQPSIIQNPDISYLRTAGFGGQEARQILGSPEYSIPDVSMGAIEPFKPQSNKPSLNMSQYRNVDPAKISTLYGYIQSLSARRGRSLASDTSTRTFLDAQTALNLYRDAYGDPDFNSIEWSEFFKVLPTSMKLDVVSMIDK